MRSLDARRGRKRVTYCDRVNATMPCGRMYPERTRGPRSNLGPLLFVTGIRLLSFTASSVRLSELDDAQELCIRFWSYLCRAFASTHRQLIGTSGCRDDAPDSQRRCGGHFCSTRLRAESSPSVNQAGAGRLFERSGERAIFLAVGANKLGDPAQMVLRLIAVALLDLPQPIILPGLDVVRVGLQRALIPYLRDLVVAELALGVADQIGDSGDVVVTERLELLDG